MSLLEEIRQKVFAASDRPLLSVEVPEWGCTVYIRTGSAYENEQVVEQMQKLAESKKARDSSWRAWFLQQYLCDPDGNKLFSGDDYKKLGERSSKVIVRLYKEATRFNGMATGEEEEDEYEDVKKKSAEEQSGSGSDYL